MYRCMLTDSCWPVIVSWKGPSRIQKQPHLNELEGICLDYIPLEDIESVELSTIVLATAAENQDSEHGSPLESLQKRRQTQKGASRLHAPNSTFSFLKRLSQSDFSTSHQNELCEYHLIIKPVEDGYNAGRTYCHRIETLDEAEGWLHDIRRLVFST